MKIKRTKHDDVFSKLVRERAGWTCEACDKYHPEGQRQSLHCSHIFSRRHKATRWHPDNAVAHCFSCHQRLGENPVEFTQWAEEKLGRERLERLQQRARQVVKMTKHDLEDLYQHMRAQYGQMLEQRKAGEVGRIEFEAWNEEAA